jgi:hypothetical protein
VAPNFDDQLFTLLHEVSNLRKQGYCFIPKNHVMPLQEGPFYYSGRLGNTVGFARNGTYYYRNLPLHLQISDATKLSGIDFGTASKAGKFIRNAVEPNLDIRYDGQHCNRLNKILLKILYAGNGLPGSRRFDALELNGLIGYQFNVHSRISNMVKPEVTHDKEYNYLQFDFPAHQLQNIRQVIKNTHIEIKVIKALVNISTNSCLISTDQVLIDLIAPSSNKIRFRYSQPHWAETIIIMQIRAFSNKNGELKPSGNIKYNAAEIINVLPHKSIHKQLP